MRGPAARGRAPPTARPRRTLWKILAVQAVLLGAAIAVGHWWLYPLLWLAAVPHRVAGHQPAALDRRARRHAALQGPPRDHALRAPARWSARFVLVPYNIGWHLAHHVDSGVPMRNLPALHRALARAGYVDETLEYAVVPGDLAGPAPHRLTRSLAPMPTPTISVPTLVAELLIPERIRLPSVGCTRSDVGARAYARRDA